MISSKKKIEKHGKPLHINYDYTKEKPKWVK